MSLLNKSTTIGQDTPFITYELLQRCATRFAKEHNAKIKRKLRKRKFLKLLAQVKSKFVKSKTYGDTGFTIL